MNKNGFKFSIKNFVSFINQTMAMQRQKRGQNTILNVKKKRNVNAVCYWISQVS